MAFVLIWSARAAEDLEAIAEYIARDSDAYSSSVTRSILDKTRILSTFPLSGRVVPEFDDKTIREIFAYSYRIIYQVEKDSVRIAAIIHGRRNIDSSLRP
jgi:toxin ParE1/3/4